MALDLEEDLQAWHKLRPQNIRIVLDPSGPNRIHFPLLAKLLHKFGWEDQTLLTEIQEGFPVLGKMSPGLGWERREDMKIHEVRTADAYVNIHAVE